MLNANSANGHKDLMAALDWTDGEQAMLSVNSVTEKGLRPLNTISRKAAGQNCFLTNVGGR
ncbi:MAG: hypothetical protein K0S11_693 [Gammaproteobacteria bacterium]|nr:hypothetical protein [Gammaproteobacteria bacterium]